MTSMVVPGSPNVMRSPAMILAILVSFVVACGAGSRNNADTFGRAARGTRAARDQALTVGRWRIRVTVKPSQLGPITVTVKNLRRAKPTTSHPWIEHDLVFRNTGDQAITFANTRSSAFIGEHGHRQLLVADEGCGYAQDSPKAPATSGVCNADLPVPVTVNPHASARVSISIYEGLPGMNPLVASTYVFPRPIRFRLGAGGQTKRHSAVLRLVYEVRASTG